MATDLRARIEANSIPVPESGCWLWTGASKKGYGRIDIVTERGKRPLLAHRISYGAFVGPIPSGMSICHKCDTPSCVNPAHLFCATHKENMQDMARKGRVRSPGGEASGLAKLTAAQALEIFNCQDKQSDIAARYGISSGAVANIKQGRNWSRVTGLRARKKYGGDTWQKPRSKA